MYTTHRQPARIASALYLALALATSTLVVGCGGSPSDLSPAEAGATNESYTSVNSDMPEEAMTDGMTAGEAKRSSGDASDDAGADAVVIRTAYVSLRTRNYDDALVSVKSIIKDAGGNVVNSSESGGYSRSITIEARVDPSKLEATVEQLRSIDGCTVESANVSANDVTRTYNDTERRIEILNQQYEHYKKMLEEATTTEDILEISDRMYDVMAEIKSYTDARDDMKHDADRSQLTVTLNEETAPGEGTSTTPGNFAVDAWEDSWGIFGSVMRSLVYAIILLFPYLLIAAIIVLIVRTIRRRKRARTVDADSGAEAQTPAADENDADEPTSDEAPTQRLGTSASDDEHTGRPQPPR